MAFFTAQTTMSPIRAYRRREFPSTLMHMAILAPVLSATSNRVYVWITVRLPYFAASSDSRPGTGRSFSPRTRPWDARTIRTSLQRLSLDIGRGPRGVALQPADLGGVRGPLRTGAETQVRDLPLEPENLLREVHRRAAPHLLCLHVAFPRSCGGAGPGAPVPAACVRCG